MVAVIHESNYCLELEAHWKTLCHLLLYMVINFFHMLYWYFYR